MEKVINLLLVLVIVSMLKTMYFPKKEKTHLKGTRRQRAPKGNPKDESSELKNYVDLKKLVMPAKRTNDTVILPVGTLEITTKNGVTYQPVTFNKHGQFVIGSADDCDLVLHSPYIGGHHCSIEYDDLNDEIVLFDNESKNGIYDEQRNKVDEVVMEKGKTFYLAKCIRIRWNEFNAFMQLEEDELPFLDEEADNSEQREVTAVTKVIKPKAAL